MSSLGTLSFKGCRGDKMVFDNEASLSTDGPTSSGSEDGASSSFGRVSSIFCCGDETIVGGDSPDVDREESSLVAAVGVVDDFEGGFETRDSDFQGSSTCSLTESNAAETQRSKI